MPYALLALGLVIGLYGLYTFFLNATPKQVMTMSVTVVTGALALALFLLAMTGRLPMALAALSALWPIGVALYRRRMTPAAAKASPFAKPLSRADALHILGLDETATEDDIQDAYKRLMMKVHPDQQGTEWMASQLNAARDVLLKK
jgi:hypothetical protein